MWKDFKAFILRGNVLDLAVAVIIAGAFALVVGSFTKDVLLPPVGLLLGDVDFTELAINLQAAEIAADGEVIKEAVDIRYGKFIQTIIDFMIIAFVIFMIVRAYDKSKKKEEEALAAPPEPSSEENLLTEIRDLLKKK